MADLIADLVHDLREFEQARERSQQVETGASQVGHCRAEAVLRVRGVPESDPRLSWQAWVGNAIHERLQRVRENNPRYLTEKRLTYQGVPCTVDVIDMLAKTVIDYKSKDDADKFPDECRPEWLMQVNLGAAAANANGIEVTHVAVIVLPRAGEFEAQLFGPYPVDPAMADEGAEWVAQTDSIAADTEVQDLSELRDQPPMWCRSWCPHVTTCRGEPYPEQPLDDVVAEVAEDYDQARTELTKAQGRLDEARELLLGIRGTAGPWKITTSGGREKVEEVEDIDRVREWWEFIEGELPVREVRKMTPVRLTVTRQKS